MLLFRQLASCPMPALEELELDLGNAVGCPNVAVFLEALQVWMVALRGWNAPLRRLRSGICGHLFFRAERERDHKKMPASPDEHQTFLARLHGGDSSVHTARAGPPFPTPPPPPNRCDPVWHTPCLQELPFGDRLAAEESHLLFRSHFAVKYVYYPSLGAWVSLRV